MGSLGDANASDIWATCVIATTTAPCLASAGGSKVVGSCVLRGLLLGFCGFSDATKMGNTEARCIFQAVAERAVDADMGKPDHRNR